MGPRNYARHSPICSLTKPFGCALVSAIIISFQPHQFNYLSTTHSHENPKPYLIFSCALVEKKTCLDCCGVVHKCKYLVLMQRPWDQTTKGLNLIKRLFYLKTQVSQRCLQSHQHRYCKNLVHKNCKVWEQNNQSHPRSSVQVTSQCDGCLVSAFLTLGNKGGRLRRASNDLL